MDQQIVDKMAQVKNIVKKTSGLDLSGFKDNFLDRRVKVRLSTLNISDFSEYLQFLSTDFKESSLLYRQLSINVTKFFRDPHVWRYLQQTVVPILTSKSRHSPISVWSCACASGEEPYSISILLTESLKDHGIDFQIMATDISSVAIDNSKIGIFDKNSLVNVSTQQQSNYFEETDEEKFLINSEIKNKVTFRKADMLYNPQKSFDIIFCRNVLIYYKKPAHELVFKNFFNVLKEDGLLVLGQDESLLGTDANELFDVVDNKCRIYSKRSK